MSRRSGLGGAVSLADSGIPGATSVRTRGRTTARHFLSRERRMLSMPPLRANMTPADTVRRWRQICEKYLGKIPHSRRRPDVAAPSDFLSFPEYLRNAGYS